MKNRKKIEKIILVLILAYIFIIMINYCFKDCYNINNDFYEISKKNDPIKISYSDIEEIENLLETEILIIGNKKIEIESFNQKAEINAIGVYGRYEKFFNSHLKQGVFIQDYHDEINNSAVMSENLLSRMTGNKNVLGEQIKAVGKGELNIIGVTNLSVIDFISSQEKLYVPINVLEDSNGEFLVDAIYVNMKNEGENDISAELVESVMEYIEISKNNYQINKLKSNLNLSINSVVGIFSEKLVTLEFYVEKIKNLFKKLFEEMNIYKSNFRVYSEFLMIIFGVIIFVSLINLIILLKMSIKFLKNRGMKLFYKFKKSIKEKRQ
jgi:hypothetical protein